MGLIFVGATASGGHLPWPCETAESECTLARCSPSAIQDDSQLSRHSFDRQTNEIDFCLENRSGRVNFRYFQVLNQTCFPCFTVFGKSSDLVSPSFAPHLYLRRAMTSTKPRKQRTQQRQKKYPMRNQSIHYGAYYLILIIIDQMHRYYLLMSDSQTLHRGACR